MHLSNEMTLCTGVWRAAILSPDQPPLSCTPLATPHFEKSGYALLPFYFHKSLSVQRFAYMPTFKFQKEVQMTVKCLKRRTFLNFLCTITIGLHNFLQKEDHMIKSLLLQNEGCPSDRRSVGKYGWISAFTFSQWIEFAPLLFLQIFLHLEISNYKGWT